MFEIAIIYFLRLTSKCNQVFSSIINYTYIFSSFGLSISFDFIYILRLYLHALLWHFVGFDKFVRLKIENSVRR